MFRRNRGHEESHQHGHRHGHRHDCRGARGGGEGPWGFDPRWMGGWFGGGPGGRHRGGRGGRMFEQGDLKYVILQLLSEKPRHGYEIIKALEDRFGGTYSPSPGAVYPTLTFLEDTGYARTTVEPSGKKIYEITDEGRAYLEQNRGAVSDIFDRIGQFADSFFGVPMEEIHRAFKNVARATYSNAMRLHDPAQLQKIRDILERAAAEIEAVAKSTTNL
jgi:DNA-binding PadR family transcriptional regulator